MENTQYESSSSSFRNLNQSIEKNQLRKSRHLAIRNKEKKKKLIKIQKGTNYNIVLRNIKVISTTLYATQILKHGTNVHKATKGIFLYHSWHFSNISNKISKYRIFKHIDCVYFFGNYDLPQKYFSLPFSVCSNFIVGKIKGIFFAFFRIHVYN